MLNKAQIIGNLGADPEVRYTQSNTAVANFSVATTEKWKDNQTGERKEKTEWHKVTFFGRVAEVCGEYLTKGSKVYIEGRLQTDKWTDKNNVERYTTKIIGSNMVMLGKSSRSPDEDQKPQQQQAKQSPPDDDLDDDIPF